MVSVAVDCLARSFTREKGKMHKFVRVTGHDGVEYEILPTEGLIAFLRRLAEEACCVDQAGTCDHSLAKQTVQPVRSPKRVSAHPWEDSRV